MMINYDVKKIYQWPVGPRVIVFLVAALIVFLICYMIDIPSFKSIIEYDVKQEADMKQQLQLMLDQQITVKGNIAQLPAIKALLQEWQQKIITKPELQSLQNEILKLGQNNQLKINVFNPDDEVKDGIYYKIPVAIDMSGTYDQIANFISQLANMPKLININSFIVSRLQDDNKAPQEIKPLNSDEVLNAKVDIEIYRK